ncbi:pheromone A receptor-domain-containing protein [Suillus paluster]|uniref:pheromone A receptor-domain-containing protein n=1 Tax=Suillus paluster TaxID=48578 RepID=UPI001B8726AC|nr:pheromone A receptor-domain-containing protein [Suillus paluster]KAG1750486.1 pheromone A receptor-domain-containing protein [Suillus paluster]
MFDSPDWVFSAFAFLGFMCCMIPLPWHFEAWNTGTCLYMIWTGLASNVINWAPVWCDISTKFMIGSSIAIPACSLCINRRLYHIASVSSVTKTRAQKRRDIMTDLAIGVGIPVLEMILQYIVQGHRFNIFEEIGCYPATFNTPPAYALVFVWPVVIGCFSAYYCIRTIIELAQRRAQFMELLCANKNLSANRYFRLMGLAGIEVLCTLPLGAYTIYLNVTAQQINPWVSWANTHYDFSRVDQYPSVIWRMSAPTVLSIELSRWLVVVCALVFFAFFGFADEARKNYRLAYVSVAKRVGVSTGNMSSGGSWTANGSKSEMGYNSRTGTMPVFVTQRTERKRDSFTSFSTDISIGEFNIAFDEAKEIPYSLTDSITGSISKESLPSTPIDGQAVPLPDLPVLARPSPTLDIHSVPRLIADSPESPRSSIDIV